MQELSDKDLLNKLFSSDNIEQQRKLCSEALARIQDWFFS